MPYEKLRIPLAVTLGIKSFTGTTINEFSSFMKNMVAEVVGPEPQQKTFARHRPAFISSVTNDYAPFGYQIVDVGGAITGASATGLANDATEYTASIDVDGATNAIAITGSTAQTYTNLLAQLNNDLTGATADIWRGNVRVYSTSTGASSTIDITDTDLFSTLSDYVEIETAVDGQAAGSLSSGRGVYYWESTDTVYMVNDTELLKDSYTHIDFVTTGYKKVYFTEVGTELFITDPQNNEGWTLDSSENLTQISNADFPSTLAHGNATLNGIGYVMDTAGVISGSASEDATSWSSLDQLTAERKPDGGIFIGLHHDNIVAIGPSSIEFFEDVANPTGSVLQRRDDVFYSVGGISGDAVWIAGDVIYFLGTEAKGSLALYKLENYQLTKISSYGVNSYLTNLIYRQSKGVYFSGFQAQGKTYVLINAYDTDNSSYADIYYTFAFDPETGFLYWFTSNLTGVGANDGLQIVDWTLRSGTSAALSRGITSTGTIVSIIDNLSASDSDTGLYVETDYWVTDYAEGDGGVATVDMPIRIRTGFSDNGTALYKHPRCMELAADYPLNDVNILVSWSKTDTRDSSYSTQRTLALGRKRRVTRIGRFQRISYDLEYEDNEPIRLEAIELPVSLAGR